MTGGWLAMTTGELEALGADEAAERHWSASCWCGEAHGDAVAGLIPPPGATGEGAG